MTQPHPGRPPDDDAGAEARDEPEWQPVTRVHRRCLGPPRSAACVIRPAATPGVAAPSVYRSVRPMTRVWLLVAVGAASLCVASAVGATGKGQPTRVGPVYLVSTGHRVALGVWRTTDGYCVSPDRVGLRRVYCIPRTWLRAAGPTFTWLSRGPRGTTLVVGIVKQRVHRGQVEDRRGTAPVPLYEAPAGLGTSLRFFRAVVRTGTPPKWRVRFYDGRDRVVGSVGQVL